MGLTPVHDVTLDQHTDCVEFCPWSGQAHLLAVATYQLDEASGRRLGGLRVLDLSPEQRGAELCQAETAGVLDVKWGARGLLYAATAAGELEAWALTPTETLEQGTLGRRAAACAAPGSICLSVDLALPCQDGGGESSSSSSAVCSAQDGTVALLQTGAGRLALAESWRAHEAEVWSSVFCGDRLESPQLVLTGADDCRFRGWDVRAPKDRPVFDQRKGHGAGVCCIRPQPCQSHIVATGSYDERLRLWDLRQLSAPTQTAQLGLGGGVWRLEWHPSQPQRLAAACMHNGLAVVRTQSPAGADSPQEMGSQPKMGSSSHKGASSPEGDSSPAIEQQGLGGTGLLYGVSWGRGPVLGGRRQVLATCRFYEARVTVFEVDS